VRIIWIQTPPASQVLVTVETSINLCTLCRNNKLHRRPYPDKNTKLPSKDNSTVTKSLSTIIIMGDRTIITTKKITNIIIIMNNNNRSNDSKRGIDNSNKNTMMKRTTAIMMMKS